MTIPEIRRKAIDSATRYLQFLIENQLGEQIIKISKIDYEPKEHIKITLAERLPQTEAFFFRVLTTGEEFGHEAEVLRYDRYRNVLYITPDTTVIDAFKRLQAFDLVLVSDLKFLVARVRLWYIHFGATIQWPLSPRPSRSKPFDLAQMCFIKGREPSEEQRRALQELMTSPFSYVWGPPGTGKTQYVLSYAVMHYMRQDAPVLICAPTNNALEQMLRGIIAMTDQTEDIPRQWILRLGAPSVEFARQYPEVCIEGELELKAKQCQLQIDLLRRVSGWEFPEHDNPKDRLLTALLKKDYAYNTEEEIQAALSKYENDLEFYLQELRQKKIEPRKTLVVACTLDMLLGSFVAAISAMISAHLFLDEAGYASLIKALPLFAYRVPVTFLGDHMQLPPVCEWQTWENEPVNRSMLMWVESAIRAGAFFSARNLATAYTNYRNERYPASDTAPRILPLTKTYRFSENLTSILDAHIYRNGFHAAGKGKQIRISVLDVPRQKEYTRRASAAEAAAIWEYLDARRHELGHYAVITPYRAQVQMLNRMLPVERRQFRIMTVHKCQGQEWDTVFFSVVDTDNKWFTDSQNKLSKGSNLINTAVSRVKKHLIIVCDRSYWIKQSEQLIGAILKKATI